MLSSRTVASMGITYRKAVIIITEPLFCVSLAEATVSLGEMRFYFVI